MTEEWSLFVGMLPQAATKLGVALLCGALLGMEREVKEKPAGLRTITLITMGATLFMIISDLSTLVTEGPEAITRVDPTRIAAQVVTGIGFLGAGAIIQARGAIHGLTTAATIWVAAGIGLCIGTGFPLLGIGITLLVLLVLVLLSPASQWLARRGEQHTLALHLPNDALVLGRVKSILENRGVSEDEIRLVRHTEGRLSLRVFYRSRGSKQQHLLEELATVEDVQGGPVEDEDA